MSELSGTRGSNVSDLAGAFPNKVVAQFFQQEWIGECLKQGRSNPDFQPQTKEVARWAREQIKLQLS
jgi:importin subunit beta-1